MALETETIELKTLSTFDSAGIDAAIAKYQELDALHQKLSSLSVKVDVSGFAEINRELAQMDSTLGRISAKKGFDQVNRQIDEHLTKMRQARAEFEQAHESFGGTNYFKGRTPEEGSSAQRNARLGLEKMQRDISAQEAEADRLFEERKKLASSAFPVEAPGQVSGASKGAAEMSDAARRMAEAEEKLAAPAREATAILEKQDAISRKKAAATRETSAAVKQLSEAERGLKGDAEGAASAVGKSAAAGRLYAKTNGEGEVVEEKFQVSPSDTMIRRGEDMVTTHRDLAEAAERAAEAERNWRVQMAAAGTDLEKRLQFSRDYVESLRAQREELGAQYQGSPEVASIDTKLARGQSAVADAETKIAAERKSAEDSLQRQRSAGLITQTKEEEREIARREAAERTSMESLQRQRSAALVREEQARQRAAEEEVAHQLKLSQAAAAQSNVSLSPSARLLRSNVVTNSGGERTSTTTWEQLNGRMKETISIFERYNATGELVEQETRKMEKAVNNLGQTGDWSARSFLHNTFVVGAWAASVGTFYAAVNTLKTGAEAAVDIERKFATLETVFHANSTEALMLRDSVLQLAAAEGRSTDEAMDAATRFARLGLSRVEILEATTQALKASNIAQISTAESAEYLSAIMVGYGLHAKDLSVVLNQLNSMAISYNVTNKEMLDGISRVSSLAMRAKLPLAELAGLIAGGVGATGRPGAEFGNAIKAIITSVDTPSKQKKLENDYGIEVKTQTDDMKDFGTILSELYVRYQQLTGAQQVSLLQMIGQRQQGARLAAMLDNYVASQVLAIRAQTDLNSAERENANIRATMSSQLETLRSEFERMSVNLVASGGDASVSNGIQEVIKLISNSLTVLADHPPVLVAIITLMTMMAARIALVAVNMEEADGKGNFFLNTIRQITLAFRTMYEAMEQANAGMAQTGTAFAATGAKAEAASAEIAAGATGMARVWTVLKTTGGFLVGTLGALLDAVPYIAAVAGAVWAINKAFDYFNGSAQKAVDQMAGLNDEIERANNLGNAAAQAARLFGTIEKAAPSLDDKGFEKAAHGVAEISFPDDDRRRQAMEDDLERLRKRGKYEEINAKLESLRQGYLETANSKRAEALRLTQEQLSVEQQTAATLQAQIDAKNKVGRPADREREQLREVQDRMNALNQKRGQDYDDMVDDATQDDEQSPLAKLMEAQVKALQKGMDDFSGKLPASGTQTDKIKEEIDLLNAKKTLLNENADAARNEYQAAEDAAQAKIKAAKGALDAVRDPGKDDALQNLLDAKARARAALDRDMAKHAVDNQDIEDAMQGWEGLGGMGRFLYQMSGLPGSHPGAIAGLNTNDDQTTQDEQAYGKYAQGPERFTQRHQAYFDTLTKRQAALDAANKAEEDGTKALHEKSQALDDATKKQQAAIEADMAQAQAEMRLAEATDRAEQGVTAAKNVERTGAYGTNESEKIWNRSQAVYDSLKKDFVDETPVWQGQVSGQDAVLDQVQREAGIREKLRELRDAELSATQRQAELEAEIKQEMIRQNEEASKALMMGSRQEQMQATMIARYLQKRGGQGFSADEFMFFDQGTREAITKFFPSAAPTQAGGDIDKLLQERAQLPEIIRRLQEERDGAEGTFGGVNPDLAAARYAGADANVTPPPPQIALNLGGVHIDIGDQFAKLTTQFQNVVAQQLQPQFDKMSGRIAALERANVVTNGPARA